MDCEITLVIKNITYLQFVLAFVVEKISTTQPILNFKNRSGFLFISNTLQHQLDVASYVKCSLSKYVSLSSPINNYRVRTLNQWCNTGLCKLEVVALGNRRMRTAASADTLEISVRLVVQIKITGNYKIDLVIYDSTRGSRLINRWTELCL